VVGEVVVGKVVVNVDGGCTAGYARGFFAFAGTLAGAGTATGRRTSSQHAAPPMIDDQKATHSSAGMTISPLRIRSRANSMKQRFGGVAVPEGRRDTDA
jgi:hypothetical protein